MTYANQPSTAQEALVIHRTFDAPVNLVWQAWTDPNQVTRWYGARNFTCPVALMNFCKGGKYLICMRAIDGTDFWSTGTYKEIIPLKKIVATDSFADEMGNVVAMEGLPLEMEVTLLFEDLGGRTKLTIRHAGLPKGETTVATRDGWNEQLDKLMSLLGESVLAN